MIRDLICKLLPIYGPENVLSNFPIFIPGITCLDNRSLIEAIFEIKRKKERHKVILFDEVGQELKARGSALNKVQTEVVNFAWQMPKRDIILQYCSNPGNSADIILRLAAWQTIMPTYYHAPVRADEYITCAVLYNYELWIAWWTIRNVAPFQNFFSTTEPIE